MSDDVLVVTRQRQLAELWGVTAWRVVANVLVAVVLGVVGGLLWSWATPLPSYVVGDDMTATITERGNTSIVVTDVAYTFITGAVGLVLGVLGWLSLYRKGWVVIVAPLLASLAAAVVTWRVGLLVTEGGFVERLARAQAGDVVHVDLALRSASALLVAPFAAITPIMLLAAFWPEPRVDRGDAPRDSSD
ncbi:hypothetical protein [Tessaracoccus lapidicaptus]|uniref:hypothetical protein n=1 Tax=Tessaracoccus lapidicaptus TaxID=1427523 RepID=UPI003342395C